MKPRLLDLFCGAGGCAKGYQRAGFDVWGVDINPQPNYCGDHFTQMDALSVEPWFLAGFDAIHASPPCQGYHGLGSGQDRLIGQVRELLDATGLPYVIENIEGARFDMRDPITVCGTMFDPILGVRRHRLFEANWNLEHPDWPCRHSLSEPRFRIYEHGKWHKRRFAAVYGHGGGKANAEGPEAMGIDWMTRSELVEAIPPAYTEFIGLQLMAYLDTGMMR